MNRLIAFERELANSPFKGTVSPVKFQNAYTQEGWGGASASYSNSFTIRFLSTLTEIEITTFFKKNGITNYKKLNYGIPNYYTFYTKTILDRSYMPMLDKMWIAKEVMSIEQELYKTAGLD